MRYTGPVCRICRREGRKLILKGVRCETQKCSFLRHSEVPGKYGKNVVGKKTEYYHQLRAKQSARRIYGLSEKQFRMVFLAATKSAGVATDNFCQILERRFDNVVFRAGLAPSRAAARQLVNHGLLKINNRRAMIASRQLKLGDKISAKKLSRDSILYKGFVENKGKNLPNWLKLDAVKKEISVAALPGSQDAEPINAQMIIEFYSR